MSQSAAVMLDLASLLSSLTGPALCDTPAGATTYAAGKLSPTAAYVDCLGDGEEDIDREGR